MPKLNFFQNLSICHWNLNITAAHNFIKVSLLIAYNPIHKYEFSMGRMICILISLYRSSSKNQEEFDTFLDNLESNLETVPLSKPFLTILICDFNAKYAS